jgi:ferredoxin-NADP reductase
MGPTGRLTKELIAQSVPNIASRRAHLCGPPPMMEAIQGILAELGLPKEQVKTESFTLARGKPEPDQTQTCHRIILIRGSAAATPIIAYPDPVPKPQTGGGQRIVIIRNGEFVARKPKRRARQPG